MSEGQESSTCRSRVIRGVELARQAGISVQQVRNYEKAGLLPTVARSAGGHREFDDSHERALLTARALVRAYGWDGAVVIMTAVHRADLPAAVGYIDQAHGQLAAERERVQHALQAFEIVVTRPDHSEPQVATALDQLGPGSDLRIGQLAHLLGVRTSSLRFWERAGLIRPTREPVTGYRSYDRTAARDAQLVRLLRQGDFPMAMIRAALDEMHSAPDGRPERVGAELRRREQQLQQRSLRRLRANALLVAYLDTISQAGQPGVRHWPGPGDRW